MTTPIPVPPGIPFLGNINNLDNELPIRAQIHLYKTYGEIYQLNLFGRKIIFVNSQNLANEISDEKRFKKTIAPALLEARRVAGDGLFTAYNDEPNWGKAHRLLMPAFGPTAIRGMYDRMADIASQLLLKWERFGPEHDIDPTDDFTRLALDTILLCSMSHRLNSFYLREEPEYATHMTNFLKECGVRPGRLRVVQALMASASAQFEMDADWLIDFSDKLVAERQAHPTDQKDLLNIMLNGKDPVTGEGLSAENIRYNLVTFTIAGHETTSGLLSFTMYYLLKHPESLTRLRAEIDSVVGDRTLSIDDIPKLPYLNAVLRESIRLSPTAAARGMASIGEQIIGNGKYRIPEDATIVVHTYCQHRDPAIWGEDAEEFKPERMLDGKFEALPPNSWQPFGNGMRACIGRAFAWQEAQMVVAAIIQKFDISMSDPSYTLQMKSALTIKPKDFHMRARVREGREHVGLLGNRTAAPTKSSVSTDASAAKGKQVLHVLYGSNSGSSEAFAQRIAGDAAAHGFRAQLATLNSAATRFPSDGTVVIVTASYEGQPADNAAHFVEWLTNLSGNELANSSFAVFGCGSHEWPHTYQRIPRLIDDTLAERGAKRLLARGEGDSSAAEFFQAFDEFEDQLWEALKKEYNTSVADPSDFVGIQVKSVNTGTARATVLRQNVGLGRVLSNNLLTPPDAPAKRHIVIELPEDATYQAGDYLAVLAENHRNDVHRALARFNLSAEEEIEITATGPSSLPTGKPISASALLAGYVELSQPATARDLRTLLKIATKSDTKQALETLINSYADLVLAKRLSVLDILESHPDIDLPFPNFLSLLPAMRIRQYSISSSSLADPHKVSVTMSVVEGPALSDKERRFYGVASTYLSGLSAGDKVQVSIRPAANAFRLPSDPSAPVVMFCAGAGVAPMRGFIEERAIQKASGRDVGQMVLFYGCRRPDEDFLFSKTDFAKWYEMGIVDVRPAFSRAQEQSEGCKYVQDRILHDRDIIRTIFDNNPSAKFFTCGSGKVGSSIEKALVTIIKDAIGASDTDAEAKFHRITRERYATDVFD